ncbi:MAG: Crp/Fnr family transcriptional regulator [Alphaproteobacteria bacterium]
MNIDNGRDLINADFELLKNTSFFSKLKDESIKDLFNGAYVKCYSKGQLLFLQGDMAEAFYIVIDGWVKLFRNSEDGQEVVIAAFSHGDIFAEAAIFGEGKYPVSASIIEDAKLLVVPRKIFLERLKNNSELCFEIFASMSKHLRFMVSHMEQMGTRSAPQRLAGFLCNLAQDENGKIIANLPHDKSLIAARLGMQPETLSRSFAKLKSMGVEVDGLKIIINSLLKLKDFAGE